MRFGPVPVGEAAGAILAHSVRHDGGAIRKGTILQPADLEALAKAGFKSVTVARLDAADVHEDAAAEQLARAVAGEGVHVEKPFTGRCNLHALAAGVLVIDRGVIDRLNRIDPSITVATLPEFAAVETGRMIATVKIIPFAVPQAKLAEAVAAAAGAIRVAAFRPLKVGLVATTLPSLKPSVMDKTRHLLEERLAPAGARLAAETRVAHDAVALAAALRDRKKAGDELLIVFGASAVVDDADVVPAGIIAAGGNVDHLGMPVDPGNLLVLGEIGGTPVIGAPGCARSPKENGFDWVLNRLLAGIAVTPDDITGLGVGGLLMEIVSRPQPREGGEAVPQRAAKKVAALILAAGQGRRMGGPHKLLATIGGKPLVRQVADAALGSKASSVTVVTGHLSEKLQAALTGLKAGFVHNPDYADGLSTSLRAGLANLPPDVDGAVVLLADMPLVTAEMIDRLIDAFDPATGALLVVPTFEGKRGNPVVWSARFFPDLMAVHGDTGGRHLIGGNPEAVAEVELGPAVALDIDTPEALAAAGGLMPAS
ncbi:MAG: molybdopterin-binding/glycosyltransferase family 2 protein [Bauldia sp.]